MRWEWISPLINVDFEECLAGDSLSRIHASLLVVDLFWIGAWFAGTFHKM
jgi:hypothetical protein